MSQIDSLNLNTKEAVPECRRPRDVKATARGRRDRTFILNRI